MEEAPEVVDPTTGSVVRVQQAVTEPDCGAQGVAVRGLHPGDDAEIHRIFRRTMVLGSPPALPRPAVRAYAEPCLGWYLTHGRGDARVIEQDGRVTGYALMCLDQEAYGAWMRGALLRWVVGSLGRVLTGRPGRDDAWFLRLRLRDGWDAWREGPVVPFPAHAQLGIVPDRRDSDLSDRLVALVDERVGVAGLPGWFAQLHLARGSSLGALERVGAEIVDWQRSRTMTWLAGRPVHRAIVTRRLTPPARRRARPMAEREDPSVSRMGVAGPA